MPRGLGGLDQFFLRADQGSEPFGQQGGVEWLLERLVDARTIEARGGAVIRKQSNQDGIGEITAASQILANLQSFELADREIDDDAVGVEAFGLDAGFEAAGGHRRAERPFGWQFSLEVFDQNLDRHEERIGLAQPGPTKKGPAALAAGPRERGGGDRLGSGGSPGS